MRAGWTTVKGGDWLARGRLSHVLLLALALRLAWATLVPIRPVSDALAYDELAYQLATGHGYSWVSGEFTAYWPVGTPALYAAAYFLFGHDMAIVAIINTIMGVLFVALTFALARTRFSYGVALIAALFVAIWPTWVAFTTIISSELATNILLVAGLACALWSRGALWTKTIASSVLLVGATYFRANMLPFIVLVPMIVGISEGKPHQALMRGALALVIGALLIAPWAIRNLHTVGAAVPTSTNFGVNLWIGNNPQATGGYVDPPQPETAPPPAGEVERDQYYQRHAGIFIAQHPLRYVQLCFQRLKIALDRETFGVSWNESGLHPGVRSALKLIMTGYWYVLFLAGLAGLVMFARERLSNLLSPLVVLPIATMATPILVMATERYHYALAPFVAIFAAYFIVRWRGGWHLAADASRQVEVA